MKVKHHPPDQCRLRCCAKSHTAQDTVSFPDTVLGWDTNKFINQNYTKNESTHGISYLESTSCEVQKLKKKGHVHIQSTIDSISDTCAN